MAKADAFAEAFVRWCVNAGVSGRTDWSRLVVLAQEFAEADDRFWIGPQRLATALTRIGIRRCVRDLAPTELGYRKAWRRGIARPRVTCRVLPRCGDWRNVSDAARQLSFDDLGLLSRTVYVDSAIED
jgi:hypothetical protein